MAESAVIMTPDEALERIMAVETPIQPSKLIGVTGMLPALVVSVLAIVVLSEAVTTIPRLIPGAAPPPPPYMPFNPQ